MSRDLVLATGNKGKVREIAAMLADAPWQVRPQSDFNVAEAEETGLTFIENALLKARNAARATGLPAMADDSGLVVEALHGAPGIYSARYAGAGCSDRDNVNKLLAELSAGAYRDRSAHFYCALVFLRHAEDPAPEIATASWRGRIADMPAGEDGFGYDPVFFVPDAGVTAAQLDPAHKNRISHRGQALAALRDRLVQAGLA